MAKDERLKGHLNFLRSILMDLAKENIIHRADHTEAEHKKIGEAYDSVNKGFNTLYDLWHTNNYCGCRED